MVPQFLEKYGPLTDSFMRFGKDPKKERALAAGRDPRGREWAYEFSLPAQRVAAAFDLSGDEPDEAAARAWLLLDEVPQFSLLKVIALQAFSRLIEGRDMTRCANPNCRRYFMHRRSDQRGCSPRCNNALRLRRYRAKQKATQQTRRET